MDLLLSYRSKLYHHGMLLRNTLVTKDPDPQRILQVSNEYFILVNTYNQQRNSIHELYNQNMLSHADVQRIVSIDPDFFLQGGSSKQHPTPYDFRLELLRLHVETLSNKIRMDLKKYGSHNTFVTSSINMLLQKKRELDTYCHELKTKYNNGELSHAEILQIEDIDATIFK